MRSFVASFIGLVVLLLSPSAEQAFASPGGASTDHPYFRRMLDTGAEEYGVTEARGVYVSVDRGVSWEQRNFGLPERMVYPFKQNGVETITSIGADPLNPNRVAVTTSFGLYLTSNGGASWRTVPLGEPIRSVAYITSVALSPWSSDTFAIGTSFSGAYETHDGGAHWTSLKDSLEFLYKGAGFYEEIAGLAYSPAERGILYLGEGFGGGVYRSNASKRTWTSIAFPGGKGGNAVSLTDSSQIIQQMSSELTSGSPMLRVSTRTAIWSYDPASQGWRSIGKPEPAPPISAAKQKRVARASDRSGLYLAANNAAGERLQHMIQLAKANGLNTLVVDVKDDYGRLTYHSKLSMAKKVGAEHPLFDLRELVKIAHENGIYVVGRMVVFKDNQLYAYENNKYAIWDKHTKAPWGNLIKVVDQATGKEHFIQREYWVDPFSQEVWQYNVDIAKELQSLGIDEIQFDYIRFPSDGPLQNAEYRFRRPGMSRIDALESFMVMAREALHIPISTDLYGFNCWYRMGNWIGQDAEMLANYVDAVCPMYYPSLFPKGFMEALPYLERAKTIYQEGSRRAREIVRGRAVVRPFVQAFLLTSNELDMNKAAYSDYLRVQLAGAQAGNASGFTLWNARNVYYMVTFPLTPYVPKRTATTSELD